MSEDHTIRRSQLITTFGVGSICDLGEESFVAKSIDSWGEIGQIIRFSALEEDGIGHFKIPPEATVFPVACIEVPAVVPPILFVAA